jgi:hypothetical protein
MSLVQLYRFVLENLEVVGDLVSVLLFMFVKPNGENVNQISLEVILLWSLVYLFEAGEVRRLLELSGDDKSKINESISDFLLLVHPAMFNHLRGLGICQFDSLNPLIIGHLSGLLPADKCSDLWMAALGGSHFLDFTEFIIISGMIFNLANMSKRCAGNLTQVISQAFHYVDHRYLEACAVMLEARGIDLILGML